MEVDVVLYGAEVCTTDDVLNGDLWMLVNVNTENAALVVILPILAAVIMPLYTILGDTELEATRLIFTPPVRTRLCSVAVVAPTTIIDRPVVIVLASVATDAAAEIVAAPSTTGRLNPFALTVL